MSASARKRYPTKAEIARAMQAAKEGGIDVAGLEVSPSGVIRIVEARAAGKPANDFDRWESDL